ncbi:hypothetical protein Saro_2707 [Novosphingobium aromaticivorans DSM 12444]|uniref:Uncharacterized protein n=1 Tax=Novosphingobium aromaticivorans (strain ATCC 700278 / DSM 12444 / CCUG 56034 / CIP 105152 / NBRC 16084 / F199) TaxID=279238 RepID=Q2G4T0_NOVAD|nr:hypothetical protein [Novosphingobium aromaticivorans]ABD27143.1 hypothetical protein Saro_2707 [Novosphingobium aromaticivorans DSM 12444]SCY89371.1 hypothetical protein SAMN05660666_03460 [Novosphingobium aromaticivorans]
MPLHVSNHAVDRFIERIESLPREEVVARLSGRAFRAAVRVGARIVRFPGRGRAVIAYNHGCAVVVTVLPELGIPQTLWPRWAGGPVPVSQIGAWGAC